MKKYKLNELEEIARSLTQKELEKYIVPDEIRNKVVLTTLFEGDDRVFVLYVPGETRDNSFEVARTRVNSLTGEAKIESIGLETK